VFEVKGMKPQWELLYDSIVGMSIGDVVEFETLQKAVKLPRARIYVPLGKAVRLLEKSHKRTLENVRRVGYRMVEAKEHDRLSHKQQIRARRRIQRAQEILSGTDVQLLSREEIRQMRNRQAMLAQQHDVLSRRVDRLRQENVQRKGDIAVVTEKVTELQAELVRRGYLDAKASTEVG
jgi:hypothetical protein